jgi:hypothetical protein
MDREPPPAPLDDGLPAPPGARPRPPVPDPPPRPRSKARIAVVLVALFAVGAVAGFGGAMLLDRGPCEGASFVSDAYGYCLDAPEGWDTSAAAEEPSGVDAFRHGDGGTVVYVEATRLAEGQDLQAFADSMRVKDSMKGFAVTDPVTGTLGGAPSLEWDAVSSQAGVRIVVREIVSIRDGVAWRLQIADSDTPEAPDVDGARELLATWRFV